MGRQDFLPTNPDLADILGRMDLSFEIFCFFIVLIPNFWISRSQNSGFPKIWISFQKSGFPDLQKIHTAAGGRGADGRRTGGRRTDGGQRTDGRAGGRTADGRMGGLSMFLGLT